MVYHPATGNVIRELFALVECIPPSSNVSVSNDSPVSAALLRFWVAECVSRQPTRVGLKLPLTVRFEEIVTLPVNDELPLTVRLDEMATVQTTVELPSTCRLLTW